jgi:hypothetical protein
MSGRLEHIVVADPGGTRAAADQLLDKYRQFSENRYYS